MMTIEIFLREPGNHHKIATWKNYPEVPRKGEQIVIDENICYEVISVFWNSNKVVQLYVGP